MRKRRIQNLPNYDQNDGRPGVVYVLTNDAMREGIYKIGQSTRSGAHRAVDLNITSGTGTPKLFRCIFECRTVDCGRAEKAVHTKLHEYRLTTQEFFEVDFEFAKQVITEACANQVPAPSEYIAIKNRRGSTRQIPKDVDQAHMQFLQRQEIDKENSRLEAAWKIAVKTRMESQSRLAGIKWGVGWLLGSWAVFLMLGGSSKFGFLSLILGWWAYQVAKDGPFDRHICSDKGREELAELRKEARENVLIQEALEEASEQIKFTAS